MYGAFARRRPAWLVAGLAAGLVLGAFLPHAPLHATATDRQENFAIATGPVDESLEAVFMLDFLSGTLKGYVISTATGKFTAYYETPVLNDLGVDASKNPKYLVVTGGANLRRTGQIQPSLSVCYVAELTSGKMAVYAIPWSRGQSNATQPIRSRFMLLDVVQFRTNAVRGS
jgi:hypothetical protein